MDDLLFHIKNDDGKKQLCKTIFTFDTDEHSYVIFSTINDQGEESAELSAMRYELDSEGKMTNFSPIETEEEWEIIEEVFNTLENEFEDNKDYFSIVTDEEEEKVCKIIHRFTLSEFNKAYLFYKIIDDTNNELFASAYIEDEDGKVIELIPIESEEEWELIEKQLQSMSNRSM